MNVKRFLSDTYRRQIDNRINRLVVNHKINQTREGAKTQFIEYRTARTAGNDTPRRYANNIAKITSPRPSTAITKNPIRPNSQTQKVKNSPRPQSSQSVAQSTSKEIVTILKATDYSNITPEHASVVYQKKCDDLGILPNPEAEKRFIEQFMNSINSKSLRLTGLGLGPQSLLCIVELFYTNPQLVYIDLSLNRLGNEGAQIIGEYLLLDTPMIYIDLRSNGIGIPGCTALFQGLSTNHHITNLDLSAVDGIERNRIGTEGCRCLANALSENEILSNLNVSMCGITADGCAYLGPALALNKALVTLDLTANRFGSAGAINLFQVDDSFGCLTTLILARNGIGDEAAQLICRQLARSQTIKHLDLSGNHFGKRLLRFLYDAMQIHQLTSLNLSKNRITSDSADSIHIIIRDFPQLKHINLSSNQLKDQTILQISDALKQNRTIVSLDLSDTITTDEGASTLSVVLKDHPSLQKLYLATNRISDESGVLIAKALVTNNVLSSLSLKNNELRDDTAVAFLDTLSKNTTISELDVAYNDFSYRSYVKLTQMIEEHKHTLNSNIADFANKHIEWLKSEEQRLFKYREDIAEQSDIVENTTSERNLKQEELKNLIIRKTDETNKVQGELDEIKEHYDKVAEERRDMQQKYNDIKMSYEGKHSNLQNQFTNLSQKRQHAQARVAKAEKTRVEQREENAKIMGDLKQQLNDAREQLKAAINYAMQAKKDLLDEEERQKEEARQAEIAEKKAAKKASSKKGKKKNADATTTESGGKKEENIGGKKKKKAKAPKPKAPVDKTATSALADTAP